MLLVRFQCMPSGMRLWEQCALTELVLKMWATLRYQYTPINLLWTLGGFAVTTKYCSILMATIDLFISINHNYRQHGSPLPLILETIHTKSNDYHVYWDFVHNNLKYQFKHVSGLQKCSATLSSIIWNGLCSWTVTSNFTLRFIRIVTYLSFSR